MTIIFTPSLSLHSLCQYNKYLIISYLFATNISWQNVFGCVWLFWYVSVSFNCVHYNTQTQSIWTMSPKYFFFCCTLWHISLHNLVSFLLRLNKRDLLKKKNYCDWKSFGVHKEVCCFTPVWVELIENLGWTFIIEEAQRVHWYVFWVHPIISCHVV